MKAFIFMSGIICTTLNGIILVEKQYQQYNYHINIILVKHLTDIFTCNVGSVYADWAADYKTFVSGSYSWKIDPR